MPSKKRTKRQLKRKVSKKAASKVAELTLRDDFESALAEVIALFDATDLDDKTFWLVREYLKVYRHPRASSKSRIEAIDRIRGILSPADRVEDEVSGGYDPAIEGPFRIKKQAPVSAKRSEAG